MEYSGPSSLYSHFTTTPLPRNDSVIIDYFAGQFRNKLECLVCGQTSTTFNAFQMLSLPIPNPDRRRPEISLSDCLGEFLREEILDRDNCWFVWTLGLS